MKKFIAIISCWDYCACMVCQGIDTYSAPCDYKTRELYTAHVMSVPKDSTPERVANRKFVKEGAGEQFKKAWELTEGHALECLNGLEGETRNLGDYMFEVIFAYGFQSEMEDKVYPSFNDLLLKLSTWHGMERVAQLPESDEIILRIIKFARKKAKELKNA